MQSGEDVAEFNVAAMLHEIMHGTRYELPETEPAKQDSAVLTGKMSQLEVCKTKT